MKDKRYEQIPNSILQRGIRLDTLGIFEYAFLSEDVREVIEILRGNGVFLLGGDVYSYVNEIIKRTFDGWYTNEHEVTSIEDSYVRANQYIDYYEQKNGKGYCYSLVF